jgi:nicotinamidase/pyrazinamidase
MVKVTKGLGPGTIFWDVDTQNDFMHQTYPLVGYVPAFVLSKLKKPLEENLMEEGKGALYVPDATSIINSLRSLTWHARFHGIRLFGSIDRHFGTPEYVDREGELKRNGGPFPDHCMDETPGMQKILETVPDFPVGRGDEYEYLWPAYIPHLLTPDPEQWQKFVKQHEETEIGMLPNGAACSIGRSRPVIFEKQSYDVFTNPAVDQFLAWARQNAPMDAALRAAIGQRSLTVDEMYAATRHNAPIRAAVVYGVATDYCVKAAVLGLQKRGLQTYVVQDAIKGVAPETTKQALEEMAAAGARFVTTEDVIEGRI